jgi:small subunit ribosomal protein S3
MGHKVNPRGIRLGITADWRAKWYAKPRDYAKLLHADLLARADLEKALKPAGVGLINIARASNASEQSGKQLVKITAHVARPGVVIGKKGGAVERMKQRLETIMGMPVNLSIQEVRKPELDAKLIAENIASQLVRRVSHRRAMKRAIASAMRMGALGIKIRVAGRLGGTEIARNETYQEGQMPLQEFRAMIDRDTATAHTSSGAIGVAVSIYKKAETERALSSRDLKDRIGRKPRTDRDKAPKGRAKTQVKKG